ncbi:MAG: hypothetical protein K0R65_2840 [Crocinitomicaceae bacterium]|jgi:hypothetical protein|nr:hypothetical protein [Crocinitomicaceae bacterium]
MKAKHHIFFAFLFLAGTLFGQKPEKIYGKNRVLKTNDYFLEQSALWKKEADKHPKNPDAWYNYYRASRNAYIVGEETESQDSKGKSRFDRLNGIVDAMEKRVPNSFEYHYVKWLNGYNDPGFFPYLEKAHRISPERTEPLMDLSLYYEISGNAELQKKYCAAFYNSGEYSPGLLNYSYNMLSGLEENAIILTEGDKDTEGTWLLQAGMAYRTDVKLLNVNLLFIKDYRERIFRELGVKIPAFDPMENDENFARFRRDLIEELSKNTQRRPVYAAVTLGASYTEKINENLYLTGLASIYSKEPVDHFSGLRRNFEQLYKLDYLTLYFPGDISVDNVQQFNGNYLPALVLLTDHYRLSGEKTKADACKKLARELAEKAVLLEKYHAFFETTENK